MYLYTGCEYVIRLSLLLTVGVNLFQMALSQRFKDAVSGSAVIVAALYMGTRYPLLDCERVDTKYEMSVRLTLREETEDNVIRVFLPRHYGATITDEDMAAINSRRIQYYLSYKGKSATSNRPMLQIDV